MIGIGVESLPLVGSTKIGTPCFLFCSRLIATQRLSESLVTFSCTSEEYAAEVCSSCDGWHCGSGEECVMVDMDDDPSDLEQPTCVEIQTGCDGNTR